MGQKSDRTGKMRMKWSSEVVPTYIKALMGQGIKAFLTESDVWGTVGSERRSKLDQTLSWRTPSRWQAYPRRLAPIVGRFQVPN